MPPWKLTDYLPMLPSCLTPLSQPSVLPFMNALCLSGEQPSHFKDFIFNLHLQKVFNPMPTKTAYSCIRIGQHDLQLILKFFKTVQQNGILCSISTLMLTEIVSGGLQRA